MSMEVNEKEKRGSVAVSEAVIRRLPRYYRYLGDLLQKNILRISSQELSRMMHVTSSQIRQDFNCFGGFGQQGYGYNVRFLYGKISEILGVTSRYTAIIVGVGNLGRALLSSPMFSKRGVMIAAVFDNDPAVIGTTLSGYVVKDVAQAAKYLENIHVDIAVLTVPRGAAVDTAKMLAENGVGGIWNFSNSEIDAETLGVAVENVHLGDSLMKLMFRLDTSPEKGMVRGEDPRG